LTFSRGLKAVDFFAAIAKVWSPVLPSRLGILLTHGVDGGIVAVVPNVVDRAALPVQQPTERLHAIAVNENHWTIIQA
jgi:hypothetical protein